MKERFSRAKKFVCDHPFGVSIGTGVVVGIVIAMVTNKTIINRLIVPSDFLQNLIDNPEGVIAFDVSPREKIWIVNAASKELL
jgi:hypothetical protein